MAIKKQLHSKINGKTVDVYPFTDTEIIYHNGEMLDDVLEQFSKTAGNIFAVVGDNLTEEESPKLNAELLGGKSPEYYAPLAKLDEYVTSDEFNSTLSDYAKIEDIPKNTSDLINDSNFVTSKDLTNQLSDYAKNKDVPTKTSDLTNDSNFITYNELRSEISNYPKQEDIPKNTSDLTNDSGFITSKELTNQLSDYAKADDIPNDTNTTYKLSKNGANVILTGSDGSKTSVEIESDVYDEATTSSAGLMSSDMVKKLNDIEENANNYSLPTASRTVLGGVKSGSSVTSTTGLTPCPIISGIPYYKESSESSSSGEITLEDFGITATATELNKLDGCTATVTELNYIDGVTSNIQTQLNNKAPKEHEHTISDITNFPTSIEPSEHEHPASEITSGTLGGQIIAPSGTDYSTSRIRNAVFTTTDPGEGTTSSYPNGSIVFVYE